MLSAVRDVHIFARPPYRYQSDVALRLPSLGAAQQALESLLLRTLRPSCCTPPAVFNHSGCPVVSGRVFVPNFSPFHPLFLVLPRAVVLQHRPRDPTPARLLFGTTVPKHWRSALRFSTHFVSVRFVCVFF